MQHRSPLFLCLAAVMLLVLPAGAQAALSRADDGLVHFGGATTLSFRDMVRPAYWVVRHHHRVWVPNHHR